MYTFEGDTESFNPFYSSMLAQHTNVGLQLA